MGFHKGTKKPSSPPVSDTQNRAGSAPKKSAKPEDDRLWAEVTRTISKQSSSRIAPVDLSHLRPASRKLPERPKTVVKPNSSQNTQATPTKKGQIKGPANLSSPVIAGIDRASAKKMQQGRMVIEDRIDLHGLSQNQAHPRLQSFLLSALRRQLRYILIITGKGREGRGVLREKVPEWLSEPPFGDHIIAFCAAKPEDGGTGALYVKLKRMRGTA